MTKHLQGRVPLTLCLILRKSLEFILSSWSELIYGKMVKSTSLVKNTIHNTKWNTGFHSKCFNKYYLLQQKFVVLRHNSAILREGDGTPLQYSCLEDPMDGGAWWAAVHGVAEGRTRLSNFTFTFHFHALGKEMATHSSVLAWRIPGTGEPVGLPSMGSHRVGHNWSDLAAAAAAATTTRRNFSTYRQASYLLQ